jgi:transcription elongation GreA/GreB family factor
MAGGEGCRLEVTSCRSQVGSPGNRAVASSQSAICYLLFAINLCGMHGRIILSTVSAWELGERFETTQAQKNEALREAKIAKQDGDLSENAPYQAAKEKFRTMGRVQRRLTGEMNHLIDQGHRLVDPRSWVTDAPTEAIEIGIIVEMELNATAEQFLIAGARDNQVPDSGEILPLPYNSPLGNVLLGRRAKDRFIASVNAREQTICIHRVRRPTTDEILQIFPALQEQPGSTKGEP